MNKVTAEQFLRICEMMLSGALDAGAASKLIKRYDKQVSSNEISPVGRWVESFERDYILSLLKKSGGDKKKAAREAQTDLEFFIGLMKKHNIS